MRLALVVGLLMCAAGLVLALQNPASTEVVFFAWRFESSLALVLVTAFAAGLVAGLLLMVPGRIRAGLMAASRKRDLDDLARKLADCEERLANTEEEARSQIPAKPEDEPKPRG